MDFKAGDVVTLKSGGPVMTVKAVEAQEVACLWYAEEDETFREAILPAHVLLAAEFADEDDESNDETAENADEDAHEAEENEQETEEKNAKAA